MILYFSITYTNASVLCQSELRMSASNSKHGSCL